MKTTKFIIFAIMAAFLLTANLTWARDRDRSGNRQFRQHREISKGVRKAEITRRESARLNQEQRRIQKTQRRYLADGRMSRPERRHVERMQDTAARNIRLARYNGRDRHRGDHRYHKGRYGGHEGYGRDYRRPARHHFEKHYYDKDRRHYGKHRRHHGHGRYYEHRRHYSDYTPWFGFSPGLSFSFSFSD